MYNIGARYEIIGRITDKTSVIAYMILDKATGTKGPMEKGVVEQLALSKNIYNCSAQVYSGIVNLKGINCKLSQLPKYNINGDIKNENSKRPKKHADLKIVGRVQSGRTITSYILVSLNNPNKHVKLEKSKVIELAQEGRIINAKCQRNGNELMLRGANGYSMSQIAIY